MSTPPPVNPNVHDIADRAKYGYAAAAQRLAAVQYRLAELAGTGRLDADESMRLQTSLAQVGEQLYLGTVCAVRDEDTDDCTWDEADNTYSDGRPVKVQLWIEPEEESDFKWEYNPFLLDSGAVKDYPLGTICYIAPVEP
jgi:hypothetical protein